LFDSTGIFAKQFTPVDGGYLYYPSKRGGGKLVTADEYDELVADWQKVAGRTGIWRTVGLVVLAIVVWTIIPKAEDLSVWSDSIFATVCVGGASAWILWASFAPRRLVRGRPAITQPRIVSEAKRQARALLNWPLIIFLLFLSASALLRTLNSPDRDFKSWAWIIGSGVMLVCYIWIAIQKFRDR